MSKKNTLLYLDENLVQKAKKMDVNLSKLMESAIKSKIFPSMSRAQKILINTEEYFESLEEQGRCFRLPHRIEKVKLNNIGPIDGFEETFESFTAVKGSTGSGKTFLLRSIAHACGCDINGSIKFLRDDEDEGRIDVKTSNKGKASIVFRDENTERKSEKCIILDAPITELGRDKRKEFLEILRKNYVDKGYQVILTDSFFEEEGLVDKTIRIGK